MIICLSPHFDDACFSMFAQLKACGGHVVNIFSQSEHVARRKDLPSDPQDRAVVVSRLRQAEDDRFMASLGLVSRSLGLSDAPLRRFAPFDLSGVEGCVPLLAASLFPLLDGMLTQQGDARDHVIYCPAGIGGHRDHVVTVLAVKEFHARRPGRFRLRFYEDLHYASKQAVRRAGLARLAKTFPASVLVPSFHVLSPRETCEKMEAVAFYGSQFAGPVDERHFVPASGLTRGLHEVVWRPCDA